jgi:hypothetical protein
MSNKLAISQQQIENRIFTVRGGQVMLDSELAEIYQVETRALNQAVKRNADRFPEDFMFQLTTTEWEMLQSQIRESSLTSQNVILENANLKSQNAALKDQRGKHRKYLPFVFTEQGVAGLSGVLKSEIAAKVHVAIMRAFVAMRKLIQDNQLLFARLDSIERKQLETDHKFEQIFKALESKDAIPQQGVFFDGQVFDAYQLTSRIIRSAKQSVVLIDNYIDESTLTHLAKKKKGVTVLLLTKILSTGSGEASNQLKLDVQKANKQYGGFKLKSFSPSHDRFLIIDNTEVYHLGASLKDLGKRWFAFSKMDKSSVERIMNSITELI